MYAVVFRYEVEDKEGDTLLEDKTLELNGATVNIKCYWVMFHRFVFEFIPPHCMANKNEQMHIPARLVQAEYAHHWEVAKNHLAHVKHQVNSSFDIAQLYISLFSAKLIIQLSCTSAAQ